MSLTIVRGMPGSGKSTYAKKLAEERHAIFIEPDALMYRRGKYEYDKARFEDAIELCVKIIRDILKGNPDAEIIYADVLPRRGDVALVAFTILGYGGYFNVVEMPPLTFEESKRRNVHNVCNEDLQYMIENWEPWENERDKNGN